MREFDTNVFFSGGAGMFLEYHDVVKPVWLYAVFKLIYDGYTNLPLGIIKDMPILCLLEWYLNRRYRNPLKQLDWKNSIPVEELDSLMSSVLQDSTIYSSAPVLHMIKMFVDVYRKQNMIFPIFVYSENYEEGIALDCKKIFPGIHHRYLYGSLTDALQKTSGNFTYIFSDVNKVQIAAKALLGTCSHVLVATDYRYNYNGNRESFKIDLTDVMQTHPFVRIGTSRVFDVTRMGESFNNVAEGGAYVTD